MTHMSYPWQALPTRIAWGAKWGLRFGLTFDVIALLIFLLAGRTEHEATGVTLPAVILLYTCGGLIAGSVVGGLLPATRWRVGAALVGVISALPVAFLVRLTTEGPATWTREDTVALVLFALLIGAPTGIIYRRIFGTRQSR